MSTTATGPAQEPRRDPTQTTTQRRTLRQDLSGRARDVRGEIRRQIENAQTQATQAGAGAGPVAVGLVGAAGGLATLRSIGAFRDWLTRIFDRHFLDVRSRRQVQSGSHWTSQYVHRSYETGLRQARSVLRTREYDIGDRQASAAITDSVHQQPLQREYERVYYQIEDAIENTKQEVTRAIADGGYIEAESGEFNKRELIADINERIDANHGKRIDPLGDSIPVRAANRAAVEAYKRAGVEQVGVEPEADVTFQTSEDRFVCEECKEVAADNPYALSEVPFPTLDTHLRCRCLILPL